MTGSRAMLGGCTVLLVELGSRPASGRGTRGDRCGRRAPSPHIQQHRGTAERDSRLAETQIHREVPMLASDGRLARRKFSGGGSAVAESAPVQTRNEEATCPS